MNGKAVFQGGNAQGLDNVAGQPIAEYTHVKSGTVYKLVGPQKAKNIVFKATGDYNDGDTWTLNNHPVTVTYNGGEELLPTAVLVGDVVQAVVMEDQLKLMLQKPTPQKSILRNGDWESGIINQRRKDEYADSGYGVDGWSINTKNIKLKVLKGKISVETLKEITGVVWAPNQDIESAESFQGKTLTVATVIDFIDGDWSLFIRFADDNGYIAGPQKKLKTGLNILSYTVPEGTTHIKCGLLSQIQAAGKSVQARKIKLEPGNRFTGWPVWDYGTELRKCQRYLLGIRPDNYKERIIPIGQGVATTNGKVRVLIPTPVSMRTRPVFNVDINNLRVASTTPDVENGIIPDTVNNMFYSNGLIFIDVYAKGLTVGNAYELYLFGTTTETMLFSAEL